MRAARLSGNARPNPNDPDISALRCAQKREARTNSNAVAQVCALYELFESRPNVKVKPVDATEMVQRSKVNDFDSDARGFAVCRTISKHRRAARTSSSAVAQVCALDDLFASRPKMKGLKPVDSTEMVQQSQVNVPRGTSLNELDHGCARAAGSSAANATRRDLQRADGEPRAEPVTIQMM